MRIPNLRDKKRQSVRYKVQLRLRYSFYEKTQKTTSYYQTGVPRTKGNIYANPGQEAIQKVKEGKTIDISTNGILFNTEDNQGIGQLCRIEIVLPEDKNIRALGKIVKVNKSNLSGNKVNKVTVEFTKISQSNSDRICMWYYNNKIKSGFFQQFLDRRKNKRFKVQKSSLAYTKKQLLNWNKWNKAQIVDISPEGILYKVQENKVKVNDPLLVKIYLPVYNDSIKSVGKVVRVKRNQLEFVDEVAVRLSKLKEGDRRKLIEHNYLETLVDRADTSLKWF